MVIAIRVNTAFKALIKFMFEENDDSNLAAPANLPTSGSGQPTKTASPTDALQPVPSAPSAPTPRAPIRLPDSPLREEAIAAPPVEDIFATSEPVAAPGQPGQPVFEELAEKPRLFSARLAVLIVAALVIVGGAVYLFMYLMNRPAAPAPASSTNESPVVPSANQPAVVPPVENVPAVVDTDGDRLSDSEEASIGTSAGNPDTDADGLTDYEEAKVYRTNPLLPDTDGDGFQDGAEVRGGYDPNRGGGAKLLDLQAGINSLNQR